MNTTHSLCKWVPPSAPCRRLEVVVGDHSRAGDSHLGPHHSIIPLTPVPSQPPKDGAGHLPAARPQVPPAAAARSLAPRQSPAPGTQGGQWGPHRTARVSMGASQLLSVPTSLPSPPLMATPSRQARATICLTGSMKRPH